MAYDLVRNTNSSSAVQTIVQSCTSAGADLVKHFAILNSLINKFHQVVMNVDLSSGHNSSTSSSSSSGWGGNNNKKFTSKSTSLEKTFRGEWILDLFSQIGTTHTNAGLLLETCERASDVIMAGKIKVIRKKCTHS